MGMRRIPAASRHENAGAGQARSTVITRCRVALEVHFLGNRRAREETIVIMNTGLSYLLSILWFVLWIVALVDCIKGTNPNKVLWIIVIILLPFLGSILYFLLGRGDKWA